MKTLKKLLLLSVICLPLLAAVVATTEESLEYIRRQSEFGNAAVQSSSGGRLFDANGNLIGIVTNKLTNKQKDGIALPFPPTWHWEIKKK